MVMMWNGLREKVRRKELYGVAGLGVLLSILFTTGKGSLSINGVPITDYENLLPILLIVINALGGFLAIALSMGTIPNEYKRKTSHLIWVRGVSQVRYHGELTLANMISSTLALGIMYSSVAILTVTKGMAVSLWRLGAAFLLMAMSTVMVSLFVSVLSIRLPRTVVGAIGLGVYVLGLFHTGIAFVAGTITGIGSSLLRFLLKIVPDMSALQNEAAQLLKGEAINPHIILQTLLLMYLLSWVLILWKRKEA